MFNGRLMCRIASFGQCVFVVHSQIRRPRPAALHFLCMPLLNSRRPGRANLEGYGLRRRASAAEAGRPVPRYAVMECSAAGACQPGGRRAPSPRFGGRGRPPSSAWACRYGMLGGRGMEDAIIPRRPGRRRSSRFPRYRCREARGKPFRRQSWPRLPGFRQS